MDKYDLDDIGIYEEEGEGNHYYMGYTIRKDGLVYMINRPYIKNAQNELTIDKDEWTVQTDEGNEVKGIHNLEEVFQKIDQGILH
jgi:hypothetical protein